jgi:Domain of unknown function (DUF4129)
LSKSQYHTNQYSASPPPLPSPSAPPPPATPHPPPTPHGLIIFLIVLAALVLIAAVFFLLRRMGSPRTAQEKKSGVGGRKAGGTPEEVLIGAALHRRNAETAAAAGDWAEAIRERFRAVIATLDERGLLPERADRTADEAARDAGALLPAHRDVLNAAARAFDEVEYGEYVGTETGYALISRVDELVRTEQPGTVQLPTAIAPTIVGGP